MAVVGLLPGALCAITLTVSGSWDLSIDATDLAGGAGSDLIDTYESDPAAVSLTILDIAPAVPWRIDIRKVDLYWPAAFSPYARRTSSGTGSGSVAGGDSYQIITDSDSAFFSGIGDRTDISIQLKLTGVTIQVPPDSYTTTVQYTVVEI